MIPAAVRIMVCREPQDLRRSFDGLALATRQLGADPRSGALYCFVNKRANPAQGALVASSYHAVVAEAYSAGLPGIQAVRQ